MKAYFTIPAAIFCLSILSCTTSTITTQEILIVPQPVDIQIEDGNFTMTSKTVINVMKPADDLAHALSFFSELVESSFGNPLKIVYGKSTRRAINVYVDPSMDREKYLLHISGSSVDIHGGSSQAVFYAFQTLRQMLPVGVENGDNIEKIELQNAVITDYPRFTYRGMMLDVSRHIFSVEEVKTYIDMLAMHKLSRFHWHLTDDQGWRIEIKKYPELTNVGGMRTETVIGRNTGEYDGTPYGGYYTQEEIKEIIEYAAHRYITVIPEIELPGHASAALTAYPHLGCTGGPYHVETRWGVFNDVFCCGKEETFHFLEGVLEEVSELFPSEYIHIGGDECPKTRWDVCPLCQKRMRDEGLANSHELQSYFVSRIEKFLHTKGKKIIGWDEILEGGISNTATVMSWRGTKGGIEAAKKGNQVVMTPNSHLYFDYYQSRDRDNEPFAIGGYVPVEQVYALDPTAGLTSDEAKQIIGTQANVWTEYITSFSHIQYMTLPRMAALAEVAWTPQEKREYENFKIRTAGLINRYQSLGWNFASHILSEKAL